MGAPILLETIEIENKLHVLKKNLAVLNSDLGLKKTSHDKYERWLCDLDSIFGQIALFDKECLPLIKGDLSVSFNDRNILLLAIMQGSIRNLFSEIKEHFKAKQDFVLSDEELTFLEESNEYGNSLAWIGDTAFKYALLDTIWKPRITPRELNDERTKIEQNAALAGLCDRWKLFEYRIHLDPPDQKDRSLNKIKGTLVEAIIGIVYIAGEIDAVRKAIPLIMEYRPASPDTL